MACLSSLASKQQSDIQAIKKEQKERNSTKINAGNSGTILDIPPINIPIVQRRREQRPMLDPVEILGHRAEIQRQSEPGHHEPVLRRRGGEDRFGSRDCLEHCAGGDRLDS